MAKVRFPSLELNWLSKSKDISIPEIYIVDDFDYSGCYYSPEFNETILDNTCISIGNNGLIVIKSDISPATIAHEFRHHLQFVYGMDFDHSEWNDNKSYKDAIIEYYSTSITEMDALLYEYKQYPDDHNTEWFEWLL